MRVLVTGGSGFIGRHLTAELEQQGHQVRILDLRTPTPWNPSADFWLCNVTDYVGVQAAMTDCEAVCHLAAVVGFANVMADPINTILTNTTGTDNVLRCAADMNLPVLLTSTSAVYGRSTNGGHPVRETMDGLLGPTPTTSWSYAYAKACDEALAFAYHHQRGLPVVVARLFNTVGPYQSAEAGFVLPRFVRAALSGAPLEVHSPGSQMRTFVHVRDVCRALAALMTCKEAVGQVVNVGGFCHISIHKLAERVCRILNSKSEIRVVDPPWESKSYDNVTDRAPDVRKINRLIHWEPQLTLVDMIGDVAQELMACNPA